MKTKFTNGEWNWNYDDSTKTGIKITAGDEQIVDFVGGSNLYEAEANAKLIAAAPDLLESLDELLKVTATMPIDIEKLFTQKKKHETQSKKQQNKF